MFITKYLCTFISHCIYPLTLYLSIYWVSSFISGSHCLLHSKSTPPPFSFTLSSSSIILSPTHSIHRQQLSQVFLHLNFPHLSLSMQMQPISSRTYWEYRHFFLHSSWYIGVKWILFQFVEHNLDFTISLSI